MSETRTIQQPSLAGNVSAASTAAPAAAGSHSGNLLFTNLEPQAPINIHADAYGESALRLSRLAAMTARNEIDIAYGKQPAQRLDVYLPEDRSAKNLPVFINIHGGGWTQGYKEWVGLNAPVITRFPAIYVAIEYGLASGTRHPGQLHDCFEALAWVHRNVARFGGGPRRLFLAGHSAGAHLAAVVTLRRDLFATYGLPADAIKGCFPYSGGVCDLRDFAAYGQASLSRLTDNFLARPQDAVDAPVAFVPGNRTPFFVTWAENDHASCKAQSSTFVLALRNHSARVENHMFELFDHFWMHIDQQHPDNLWTRTLRAWMTGDAVSALVRG